MKKNWIKQVKFQEIEKKKSRNFGNIPLIFSSKNVSVAFHTILQL